MMHILITIVRKSKRWKNWPSRTSAG